MAEKISIMVNGLPGKMATMLVKRLMQDGRYKIVPYSFTGPEINDDDVEIEFKNPLGVEKFERINLIAPSQRQEWIGKITALYPDMIVVDYTLPAATVANCEYYCEKGLPFVMGTTVKDRSLLASIVEKSQISAVIAPNMSKPIVAVVAMFDYVAENFAGALDGFELQIVESHQRAKQGKSGTADAIGKNLKLLGASYAGEEDILPIRNPKQQRFMGVPEDALGGHGWHSYELMSPDGSVFLKFEHNVNGRSTYIDGTEVAINFLAKKMAAGSLGKCFSMTDVMMG